VTATAAPGAPIGQKYLDLFWSKVQKADGDGCWLWTGRPMTNKFGYGRAQMAPRVTVLAHRLSWIINVGPLADNECVLHHCDNPPCVRPDHLFKGDRGDNIRDMCAKGRQFFQQHPERVRRGADHWTRHLPERISRGEAHYKAKLTAVQVREIRERRARGERRVDLERAFGISSGCLDTLLVGRSWKHAGGPLQANRRVQ